MSVCIFSTVNQIEAGLLKSALDENNIDSYLQNYFINNMGLGVGGVLPAFSGSPLAVGSNIKVFVKDEDVERALEIVGALFDNNRERITNDDNTDVFIESDNKDISQECSQEQNKAINETVKVNRKMTLREILYIGLITISAIGYIAAVYISKQYALSNRFLSIIRIQAFFSYLILFSIPLSFVILFRQKSKIVFVAGLIITGILILCQITGKYPIIYYYIIQRRIYAVIIYLFIALSFLIMYKVKNKIAFIAGLIISAVLILNQIIGSIAYITVLTRIIF